LSLNRYECTGRLGADIVLKQGENGKSYCYFNVAVRRNSYTDGNGNVVTPNPYWIPCNANGGTALYLARAAQKGTLLFLEGELAINPPREVADGGKIKVYNDFVIRVQKCEVMRDGRPREENGAAATAAPTQPAAPASAPVSNPSDDFIPMDNQGTDFNDPFANVPGDVEVASGELPF